MARVAVRLRVQAHDAAWGSDDHHPDGGHGTPLAGLVLYGDLEPLMNDARRVARTHAAKTMKRPPPRGFPPTEPPSYVIVTPGAVGLVAAACAPQLLPRHFPDRFPP